MYTCKHCGKIFENRYSYIGHSSSHNRGEEYKLKRKSNKPTKKENQRSSKKICKYCNLELENGLKLGGHSTLCKLNPNRLNTLKKISAATKNIPLSHEHRLKISEAMQKAVREKPESYSASNINGRSKKILYNDVWLDSKWEYEFAKWCDDNEINWEKNKKSFEYEWNGSRLYYPDFYLKDFDKYVEVKGYERERDLEKWKVVSNLIIVKFNEIKKIRSNTFSIT